MYWTHILTESYLLTDVTPNTLQRISNLREAAFNINFPWVTSTYIFHVTLSTISTDNAFQHLGSDKDQWISILQA